MLQGEVLTVYHATSVISAQQILQAFKSSNGSSSFRMPTRSHASKKGLKLGACVYFGIDKDYCIQEALNTVQEESGKRDVGKLSCLQVDLKLNRFFDWTATEYQDGEHGKLYWPFQVLLGTFIPALCNDTIDDSGSESSEIMGCCPCFGRGESDREDQRGVEPDVRGFPMAPPFRVPLD